MNAHGTCLLRNSSDVLFDFLPRNHHQIRKFIDNDDNVRHIFHPFRRHNEHIGRRSRNLNRRFVSRIFACSDFRLAFRLLFFDSGFGSDFFRFIFRTRLFGSFNQFKLFLAFCIVTDQIAHLPLGEFFITAVHFDASPLQSAHRLVRLRHDRGEQMRDFFIKFEFHHLRIHQDHSKFIRTLAKKEARHQRVDTDRFTGTGLTGNQNMRSTAQIHRKDFR